MLLGANWPYDAVPHAPPSTWGPFWAMTPEQVLIMSHAALADYEGLQGVSSLKLWHIRVKTGPSNRGVYPANPLRYAEWLGERCLADAIEWALARGITPQVVVANEPDIELAQVPVDDHANMTHAINFYLGWARDLIREIRALYGDRVKVALAPISQGTPSRFDAWFNAYLASGLLAECDFFAEHCYTFGSDEYDHPDQGGRFLRIADRVQLPIDILEVNDNGVRWGQLGRAEHLADYAAWVASTGRVRSLSLFTLPGGNDDAVKPAWWFLDAPTTALVAEKVREAPIMADPRQEVLEMALRLANEYGLPRDVMLGCAIAESNLDPRARRPVDPAQDRDYWPDVSMGAWQQTVRWAPEYLSWSADHGHPAGEVPGADVIQLIGDLYYNVEHSGRVAAENLAGKWRQYRPDKLETLCRYNWPGLDGVNNPNRGNYQRGLAEALEILGASPAPDPEPEPAPEPGPPVGDHVGTYDPSYPAVIQTSNWTCSAASAAWLFGAIGYPVPTEYVVAELGADINPDVGLTQGDGTGLVALFERHNLVAKKAWLGFDAVCELARTVPVLIGGSRWNHWSGVRGVTPDGALGLANPAPEWQGVGQEMTRAEFDRWGGFAAVWVVLPQAAPVPGQADAVAELLVQLTQKQEIIDRLVTTLGYLTGDVATALEQTVVKAKRLKDARAQAQNIANTLRQHKP